MGIRKWQEMKMGRSRLELMSKLLELILEWGVSDWISFLQSQSTYWQDQTGSIKRGHHTTDNLLNITPMVWWWSGDFLVNLSREVLHQRYKVKSSTVMRLRSKVAVKCPANFKISHLKVLESWKLAWEKHMLERRQYLSRSSQYAVGEGIAWDTGAIRYKNPQEFPQYFLIRGGNLDRLRCF